MARLLGAEAAGEDDGGDGPGPPQAPAGFLAPHVGHGEVHEDEADPRPVGLGEQEGLQAVPGLQGREAQALEGAGGDRADGVLVVHHQDEP